LQYKDLDNNILALKKDANDERYFTSENQSSKLNLPDRVRLEKKKVSNFYPRLKPIYYR
jgi:hypothetical protein